MRADLSLYRVFVAVADEGSFVRAAAKLYLTQPAVSQAVRRMEAQTGAKLFLRGRRSTFGDKVNPGQHFRVRVGKIHPLNNEIQILDAEEE